jgi:peroxiredoxin
MQNFQQNLQKLEAADTQVLGVSMDSTFSNAAWAEKIAVTFPLLSDWGGDVTRDVTRQYGLYNPKYKATRRVNYLIDNSGKVVDLQIDNDAVDPTKIVTLCERRKTKE